MNIFHFRIYHILQNINKSSDNFVIAGLDTVGTKHTHPLTHTKSSQSLSSTKGAEFK